MPLLSSTQALKLAADFAQVAEQMRAADGSDLQPLIALYEKASRVAFLRAHVISRDEETRPHFGQSMHRAVFSIA